MDSVTHCSCGQQVTERDDTTSSEDEDVSSQLYGFAQSIFQECYKNAAPISNLDTAIHLFREALDRRPPPHPLRSDSRKDLARALFARFSLIGQFQDLDQAIFLLGEVMQELDDISMGTRGESQLDVRIQSQYSVTIWIYHLHREMISSNTTPCSLRMTTPPS